MTSLDLLALVLLVGLAIQFALPEAASSDLTDVDAGRKRPSGQRPPGAGKDGMHRPDGNLPPLTRGRLIGWSGSVKRAP